MSENGQKTGKDEKNVIEDQNDQKG